LKKQLTKFSPARTLQMVTSNAIKRFAYYAFICASLFVVGCQDSEDVVYTRPDERLAQILSDYKSQLVSSTNGWKGFLYPQGGGAFSFYMQFTSQDRVLMLADINHDCATEKFESSFRLVAAQTPSLYFDTYSYIHILSDPAPDTIGGVPGGGLFSDFEFSFLDAKEDTIRFRGNVHHSEFVLIKATVEDAQRYSSGGLQQMIQTVDHYLNNNFSLYLITGEGKKTEVAINKDRKEFMLMSEEADTLYSRSVPFSFTTEGLYLQRPMLYEGESFQQIFYDATTTRLFVRLNGKRKDIRTSEIPVLPLYLTLGEDKTVISIPPRPESEGWSDLFKEKWESMGRGFYGCCYLGTSFTRLYFDKSAGKMYLLINVIDLVSGAEYLVEYPYSYKQNSNHEFEFTAKGEPNANGEYFLSVTDPIRRYIDGGKFTVVYTQTTEGVQALATSVDNPAFYFTGNLE
jgi:hypothetical protein